MSDSATEADDDATMTRDAGASRTFRSIFGDAGHDGGEDELKLQRFSRQSDRQGDANGYRDSADGDDDEDDDDGVWSDDAAPPKEPSGDDCENGNPSDNNSDDQAVSGSAAAAAAAVAEEQEDDEVGWGSSDASAPRSEELKIPHRRSMEEWADDDDDEDAWKDMLQAKVNQLELVIQSNNEASHAGSQLPPSAAAVISQVEFAHADSRIALATATHTASLRTATTERPTSRNKIQRLTSGGHSQASGDHDHHRHVAIGSGVHAPPAPAVSSPSNYLRKRSGSRDFVSNRAAKPADSKKSAKVASGSSSSRRDSLTRSSSASSISATITRSSNVVQRKNSLDACSTGAQSRNRAVNGTVDTAGGSASAELAGAAPEPLRPISEVEAVRRFILQDIKQMSMDRLVADARRLCFLEDFYTRRAQNDAQDDDDAS